VEPSERDVIIVGAGPAGCSAAIMANSVGLSVTLIEAKGICSLLHVIPSITNLFGMPLSGSEIGQIVEGQIRNLRIQYLERKVITVSQGGSNWWVQLDNSERLFGISVIIATGTRPVQLQECPWVSGAEQIDCLPLYEVHPRTIVKTPLVVVGCDRAYWTWAERHSELCKDLDTVLLAFPDKWHLEDEIVRSPSVRFVKCQGVISIRKMASGYEVVYKGLQGDSEHIVAGHIASILGNMPNLDLLISPLRHLTTEFLSPAVSEELAESGCYVVGDVAHHEAQRVAVAVGDGAKAALECFYKKKSLYGR